MWPATTAELWQTFCEAGVMVSCIRYGGRDPRYEAGYREALECEVVYCPANLPDIPIPRLVRVMPRPEDSDPHTLCIGNATRAYVALRHIVGSTGLTFRFTGQTRPRLFRFDGPNPTALVEPKQDVLFGGQQVTVELSLVDWLTTPCPGGY